jgi:hypothetical protein
VGLKNPSARCGGENPPNPLLERGNYAKVVIARSVSDEAIQRLWIATPLVAAREDVHNDLLDLWLQTILAISCVPKRCSGIITTYNFYMGIFYAV